MAFLVVSSNSTAGVVLRTRTSLPREGASAWRFSGETWFPCSDSFFWPWPSSLRGEGTKKMWLSWSVTRTSKMWWSDECVHERFFFSRDDVSIHMLKRDGRTGRPNKTCRSCKTYKPGRLTALPPSPPEEALPPPPPEEKAPPEAPAPKEQWSAAQSFEAQQQQLLLLQKQRARRQLEKKFLLR